MTIAAWIGVAALLLLYGGGMLKFWKDTNVKLRELDINIMNTNKDLEEHIERAKDQRDKIEDKFDSCFIEIRDNQKVMVSKIDGLVQNFNDFKVYVEKNFKK